MERPIKLFDVVALTEDLEEQGLQKEQVGTVVELLDVDVFEVDFSDDNGISYAFAAIPAHKLMVLLYQPTGSFDM